MSSNKNKPSLLDDFIGAAREHCDTLTYSLWTAAAMAQLMLTGGVNAPLLGVAAFREVLRINEWETKFQNTSRQLVGQSSFRETARKCSLAANAGFGVSIVALSSTIPPTDMGAIAFRMAAQGVGLVLTTFICMYFGKDKGIASGAAEVFRLYKNHMWNSAGRDNDGGTPSTDRLTDRAERLLSPTASPTTLSLR